MVLLEIAKAGKGFQNAVTIGTNTNEAIGLYWKDIGGNICDRNFNGDTLHIGNGDETVTVYDSDSTWVVDPKTGNILKNPRKK